MKDNRFIKGLQSVILAAAVAIAVVPTSLLVSEPVVAEAATDAVRESLNDTQKKIYNAYDYLDTRIMNEGIQITSKNKAEYDTALFYTMYTGASEKVKYADEDLKYARRAYVYNNPYQLAAAMAQLKFVYVKNSEGKYTCFAYLQRSSENDYQSETKALKSAVKKIMKNIDDDTNFVMELQCFNMVLDNATNVKIGIDNKDLKNTAYGALVQHRASSQGYALAFATLLDECEISNDILFNENKCWNQVKIGSKWYESDLVACDKAKKGRIDFERFNTSQKKMKSYGLSRTNYCQKLRSSTGTHSTTTSKIQKYDEAMFKDSHNFTLGVRNSDGSVTRSTLLSSETTVQIVPAFINNKQLYDCSVVLKSVTINTSPTESAFSWTQWTPQTPVITLTKVNPAGSRTLSVTIVYDDGSNNGAGTPINFTATLNDVDNTTSNFVYKVTGEDTVSLVKCSKKSIKNVSIPSAVCVNGKSYKVTKIEQNAFKKCTKLETVMIGAYVTEIGANAFSGKTKLIRVETLGTQLNKLGKDAFKSANEYTMFLLKSTSYNKYNKLVKKVKKAGGKKSVYKFRKN